MKIQGHRILEAPRDLVWMALIDPQVLGKTLPGLQKLETVAENRYEGAMHISIGPVQGQFSGTVEISELDPPNSYRLRLEGKGAPGFVQGRGSIRLEGDDNATTLHYDVDAQVGGRLAAVGQRLLDSSARVITQQALDGLERQIEGLARANATGARVEVAAPSQAEFAAGVARGVLADAVPPARRTWIVLFGALVLVVVAILLIRSCGA